MKGRYVSLLVAIVVVLIVSVNSASVETPKSECRDFCTFNYSPVCGYDGKCYRVYGNQCVLDSDQCRNKQDLKAVDMELCEEAKGKSNPEVVMCDVE